MGYVEAAICRIWAIIPWPKWTVLGLSGEFTGVCPGFPGFPRVYRAFPGFPGSSPGAPGISRAVPGTAGFYLNPAAERLLQRSATRSAHVARNPVAAALLRAPLRARSPVEVTHPRRAAHSGAQAMADARGSRMHAKRLGSRKGAGGVGAGLCRVWVWGGGGWVGGGGSAAGRKRQGGPQPEGRDSGAENAEAQEERASRVRREELQRRRQRSGLRWAQWTRSAEAKNRGGRREFVAFAADSAAAYNVRRRAGEGQRRAWARAARVARQ